MLNYSIGEFFGLLLTFGIMVFFSLVWIKGIFMIMDGLLGEKLKRIFHYHYHYRDKK